MSTLKPQSWLECDKAVHAYIDGFVELLKEKLESRLIGVYLHGSLAMGSYFPPKSDMDFIIVTDSQLDAEFAKLLNNAIAQYSEIRPTAGSIECSVITLQTARNVPEKMPYELHYSEAWHERILKNAVLYGKDQFDSDLPAHLMCVKRRGICLCGMAIDDVFGNVSWHNFLLSVMDDFNWIVEGENICESPYYGVLNICRVMQIIIDGNEKYLSKYEGAVWGMENLPDKHIPLIQKALEIYASNEPIDKREQKTGGAVWDKAALLAFRDYAKDEISRAEIINFLNEHYPMSFNNLEKLRDMGSTSYSVIADGVKYFLRVIKPAMFDTAVIGVEVQVYLQKKGFPVPAVINSCDGFLYVKTENKLFILHDFIEGADSDPEQDIEAIGALVGRLHLEMKNYPGALVKRDKQFYIGRYIDILRSREYPRAEDFFKYGEQLWEKIKNLPWGYCHGDMYDGNIRKTLEGELYIHDFDTSCKGIPMYDVTLICDRTEYFKYQESNLSKSNKMLSRFLPEYGKYSSISQFEIDAFYALIAVQHFSTQATVMEIFGNDCLNDKELDEQLDWLHRWREQCESGSGI